MFKKFFSLFVFLLLPLLIVSGFFLDPFSSLVSDLVQPARRSYPSDKWTTAERKQTIKKLKANAWLFPILLGLQKLEFIDVNGQSTVYYFDKIVSALKKQIQIQNKNLLDSSFDFTQIQGEAESQLFQPLVKNSGLFKESPMKVVFASKLVESQEQFFNFIRPFLLKMKILGLSLFKFLNSTSINISALTSVANLESISYADFKKTNFAGGIQRYFGIIIFSQKPNELSFLGSVKRDFQHTLNLAASPWLHTLQKAKSFDLTYLTVDKAQVDVSSLVTSQVQEASALSLTNLKIIKKLQPLTLSKLQIQVQNYIDDKLDSYKTKIQKTLENFATNKITQIEIDGVSYQVDLLLKNTNLKLTGSQLSQDAKNQLLTLFKVKITPQKFAKSFQDEQKLLTFQKNWDEGKVSSYLLWLPVFDIKKVKLSQNKVVSVELLAAAIQTMLTKEKFDFTKLQGKARKQLLNLLNSEGKLREVETFQDDIWRQIKNHQKWKTIEGPLGQSVLESIKTLLLEVQDLGISKVTHPSFPTGYDLSFLKSSANWKRVSFKNLLQGMKVVVNGNNVEFYSHLFPNQVVFQVPMKKLSTVFSEITIANTIKALKDVINAQQKKNLEPKPSKENNKISEEKNKQKKSNISNNNLTIGLSVAGSVFVLTAFGGFLYWFFKFKK